MCATSRLARPRALLCSGVVFEMAGVVAGRPCLSCTVRCLLAAGPLLVAHCDSLLPLVLSYQVFDAAPSSAFTWKAGLIIFCAALAAHMATSEAGHAAAQEYDFMGGAELTLFHDSLRVTLTVAYRAGDGGAMLFHQTGWDSVRKQGLLRTLPSPASKLVVVRTLNFLTVISVGRAVFASLLPA